MAQAKGKTYLDNTPLNMYLGGYRYKCVVSEKLLKLFPKWKSRGLVRIDDYLKLLTSPSPGFVNTNVLWICLHYKVSKGTNFTYSYWSTLQSIWAKQMFRWHSIFFIYFVAFCQNDSAIIYRETSICRLFSFMLFSCSIY